MGEKKKKPKLVCLWKRVRIKAFIRKFTYYSFSDWRGEICLSRWQKTHMTKVSARENPTNIRESHYSLYSGSPSSDFHGSPTWTSTKCFIAQIFLLGGSFRRKMNSFSQKAKGKSIISIKYFIIKLTQQGGWLYKPSISGVLSASRYCSCYLIQICTASFSPVELWVCFIQQYYTTIFSLEIGTTNLNPSLGLTLCLNARKKMKELSTHNIQ